MTPNIQFIGFIGKYMFIDLKAVSNPVSYRKHYCFGQTDITIIWKPKGLPASLRLSFT